MVDWPCQSDRTMMVLLWLVQLTCSGPNCPTDLLSEVFSCLRNLTHGSNFSTLMSSVDVKHMHQNCRNGAFDDSVQCLERLHSRCNNPEAKEWLQKLARPKRWEAGFQRFCKHINVYIEKTKCVQQQSTEVQNCVNKHSDIFTNTNTFNTNKPRGYNVNNDLMKSICSVFHWTDVCLNKPLSHSCGEPVGAIVTDFHGGITPPICIDYKIVNNAGSRLGIPKVVVIVNSLPLLMLFQLLYGI